MICMILASLSSVSFRRILARAGPFACRLTCRGILRGGFSISFLGVLVLITASTSYGLNYGTFNSRCDQSLTMSPTMRI